MPEQQPTFTVRVKPGASRTRAGGRYDGARGPALVVAAGRVSARRDGGDPRAAPRDGSDL